MKIKTKFPAIGAALLLGFGLNSTLLAGPAIMDPKSPVVYEPENEWSYELDPYLWMANLKGNVGAMGTTSAIDVGFDDVLDNLNFAASALIGARKGRFGVQADLMYIEITPSFPGPVPAFSRTDLVLGQFLGDFKGSYRLFEDESAWFDLLAGGRYMDVDLGITLQPGVLPGLAVGGRDGWWDGVVGFRTQYDLTDQWFLTAMADVGGGSSDITWQASAGVGYRFSNRINATVAYRYMDYDYTNGGFTYDVATRGLSVGLGISF